MKKEQLQQYTAICAEIAQLKEIMAQLRADMVSIHAPNLTGLPGAASGDHDKVGAAVAKYIQLSQPYADRLDELEGQKAQIEYTIASLPSNARMIMRCRYILALTWEETAARVGYSERQARRIHDDALEELK